MAVAKSYQNLEIVEQPYTISGRLYVKVRTKTGSLKQVRWYTDKEYARMYPETKEEILANIDQRKTFGFDKGYITIFKNGLEDTEYFLKSEARYSVFWGWFFPSTNELPQDLPSEYEPVKLYWEQVGTEDGKVKPRSEYAAIVDPILYGDNPSRFQGTIGDRIERTVTVTRAFPIEGYYGSSTMYTLKDDQENVYLWTTAAKSWEVDTIHTIKGTVKDHKLYKGIEETILTRCTERTEK